ncbi:MAG TPA: pyridoxamine 5'-phosphate oxidase [Rhodanobacteraceae bacterium]|nr:pyridoxamine 5'-phosphate oxidase [Rhodanobacteraceae bacterium]
MLNQEILETLRGLLERARRNGDPEPGAMNVATVGEDGRISARMVLLKHVDERGLTFFTDYRSEKARAIAAHPQIALTLHWKHLKPAAQVRVEGAAEKLAPEESDAYFATRRRLAQLGAWASDQSQTLASRELLESRVEECEREFEGREVPRPPHWGGYRVVPDVVEFWYAHEHRLNERIRWDLIDGEWRKRLLYP